MLDQQIQVPGWRGGDSDASYLNKTLRHHAMELTLDESVSGRILLRFWGRAAAIALVWYFFFFFIWLVGGGLNSSSSSSLYGDSSSGGGGDSSMLAVAAIGSFVIFWLVFLFSTLQEPIGEWRVLLADRAPAKPDVYSQIHGRLRDRGMPVSFTARRIRTGLGRDSVGDRVILVDGHYFAYISVFEYGSSLYLGWMMWRTRRGGSLVVRFVADVVGGLFGHTDPVKLMLRTERPRAMREAVHSVCREGLHVAVEGLSVPENYGFPSGLPPVEDGVLAAAVPPPSAPVPSAMAMPSSLREEPAGQAFVPPPGFEQTQVYEPPQPQPVFGEQSIPGQQPQQYQDPQQADFFRRTQPSPPQDPHPGYQHPDQQQGQQGQRQQQQWDGR